MRSGRPERDYGGETRFFELEQKRLNMGSPSLDVLTPPLRTYAHNSLFMAGAHTVEGVLDLLSAGKIEGVGPKTQLQIDEALKLFREKIKRGDHFPGMPESKRYTLLESLEHYSVRASGNLEK